MNCSQISAVIILVIGLCIAIPVSYLVGVSLLDCFFPTYPINGPTCDLEMGYEHCFVLFLIVCCFFASLVPPIITFIILRRKKKKNDFPVKYKVKEYLRDKEDVERYHRFLKKMSEARKRDEERNSRGD